MKNFFLIFVLLAITQQVLALPITINISSQNPPKINNAVAEAHVIGGTPPYNYYWSKTSATLSDTICKALAEGVKHSLRVEDANGNSSEITFFIEPHGIDEKINSIFAPAVEAVANVVLADVFALSGLYDPIICDENGVEMLYPNGTPMKRHIPFTVVWLILGALFCTIYMRFPNIRCFKTAIRLVRGKYDNDKNKGEVSHFQALATALSATVGLGNIAGVALAISIGGPGAVFWLIVAGFLGMSSKFAECTLGVKYRKINSDGSVAGGGMYYIPEIFKKHGLSKTGKILGSIFALFVIGAGLGGGCVFESNQAFAQMAAVFPSIEGHGAIFGLIMAIAVAVVIVGGIKSIAKFTGVIVPVMGILYLVTSLVIVFSNISQLPNAVKLIFNGAFNPSAAQGGFIGILIIGFQRAALSNEAGIGSSPIAHSAVRTSEPVSEGIVALLEPFIDTVIICTTTALVIIFTGMYKNPNGLDGIQLTSAAFESVFPWYPYLLLVSIILFAFSTTISWSYYALTAFKFLFGGNNSILTTRIFQLIFLSFTVIGAASSVDAVVGMTDIMMLCLAFPNFIAIYMSAKEIKSDLEKYMSKIKKINNEPTR